LYVKLAARYFKIREEDVTRDQRNEVKVRTFNILFSLPYRGDLENKTRQEVFEIVAKELKSWRQVMSETERKFSFEQEVTPTAKFLRMWAKNQAWKDKELIAIARRLITDSGYTPKGRGWFEGTLYGWLWGTLGDSVQANAVWGLFQWEMEQLYNVVAKEKQLGN